MSAIGQHEFYVKLPNQYILLAGTGLSRACKTHAFIKQFLDEQYRNALDTAVDMKCVLSWSQQHQSYLYEVVVGPIQLNIFIQENWAQNFSGRYFAQLK